MRWLKAILLKITLWYQKKIMKKSCAELVKKNLSKLTLEEEATAKFFCESKFSCAEIIELIKNSREYKKLYRLIKESFPNLDEEEIQSFIDFHAKDLKSGKKKHSDILSEIQASQKTTNSNKNKLSKK